VHNSGDIDWKGAWIHVCGKGRRHTRLPLTQEVGDAIVTYLNKGRPRTNTDTLFIRLSAAVHRFAPFLLLPSRILSTRHFAARA
jgi:integrase/recombinase XerD